MYDVAEKGLTWDRPYTILFPVIRLEGFAVIVSAAQLGKLVVRVESDTEQEGVRKRLWFGLPHLYVAWIAEH